MLNSKKTQWLLWYQFHGVCEQQGSVSFSRPHLNMLTDPFSWPVADACFPASPLWVTQCMLYVYLRAVVWSFEAANWMRLQHSKKDTCAHTHKLEVMGSICFTTETPSTQALPPHSVTPDQYGHSAFHSAHLTHTWTTARVLE